MPLFAVLCGSKNMTTLSIYSALNTRAPRGAGWAADAAVALWRAVSRWTGKAAAEPSPAVEAAEVRELARQFIKTDPGFAADLYAAADRHEALHGAR